MPSNKHYRLYQRTKKQKMQMLLTSGRCALQHFPTRLLSPVNMSRNILMKTFVNPTPQILNIVQTVRRNFTLGDSVQNSSASYGIKV